MSLATIFKTDKIDQNAQGGSIRTTGEGKPENRHTSPVLVDTRLKLKPKETLNLLIQLRAMLSAGVPLLAALRSLTEHATTHAAEKVLVKIASIVESGHDLSYALDCLPRCFEKYMVHLLSAGERAGALDESLGRGIELLDKQIKFRGKIRGALAYPGFLLFMTVVMTTGILAFLVPKFESILLKKPDQLPTTTRWVLAASAGIREHPKVIGGIAAALVLGVIIMLRNKRVRGTFFDLLSNLPVIGNLIHKAYVARSVNTLALTLESGVPILTGLEHASDVAQLPKLQAVWESAAAVVRDGRPMHTALADSDMPPAVVQMMVAGESSGALDSSLRTASDFLDRETEAALEVFTGLLGPMTVVFAGVIVGFIVVSLMTPILQMAKFVG